MDTVTDSITADGLIAGDFPLKTDDDTLLLGEDLARGSVLGKLTALAATKDSSAGPFDMAPADTMVIDIDNAGNATATFDAAAGTVTDTTSYTGGVAADVTDTTVYTGGTAGTIEDTTTYAVGDQDTLTEKFTIDGGTEQTVTFAGVTTTALQIAAQINDGLTGASAVVTGGGQVLITSDALGVDSTIAIGTGTCNLVWAAPAAGTGALADQDTLTEKFTLDGGTEQTVTFAGVTTEVAQIAAQISDQLTGASAVVTGGQVVVTADSVGVDSTIAIGTGTCALTWGTPNAGSGAFADQDTLTEKFTIDGGDEQTVTFAGVTTEAAQVASQINDGLVGASAVVTGGQVVVTSDSQGTGSTVLIGTGTSALAWAAATAGTGDVVDINAVTATECKTVIEADTTGEVTVNADGSFTLASPTEGALSELDFKSGNVLAIVGFSVEVITPVTGDYSKLKLLDKDAEDGTEVPYAVLAADCDASLADADCVVYTSGEFDDDLLVFASGTVIADKKIEMRDVNLYTKTTSPLAD